MTHYYQTFYEDLKLTGKSNRTIQIHEKHLQKIERFYNKSPEQINEEELRRYLISMKDDKHYSESFFKQAISAFRFFYSHILEHADWKTLKFIKPQKERLETVDVEFTNDNTTWFGNCRNARDISRITDFDGGILISQFDYTYPLRIYDVSRADLGHDQRKVRQLMSLYE